MNVIRRDGLLVHLQDIADEIRELAYDKYYNTAITPGERALLRAAADNVVAAYRIINTGDTNV